MKQIKNKAKLECGVAGFFHIKHLDKDGNLKFESEFKNLIVDEGMDRIATSNSSISYPHCLLLADNTPPAVTETAGDVNWSYRNDSSRAASNVGVAPDWAALSRYTYTFEASAETRNVSSVAVGYHSANAANRRLFSRALILDGQGNPTTLSILTGDRVIVQYTLNLYPPLEDVTGSITLSGNIGATYDYIIRPADLSDRATSDTQYGVWPGASHNRTVSVAQGTACYTGDLGPVDGKPSGTANSISTDTTRVADTSGTYVPGSFAVRLGYTRGLRSNPINIRSAIHVLGVFCYQIQFDPPIPKTTEDVLELIFEISWARR